MTNASQPDESNRSTLLPGVVFALLFGLGLTVLFATTSTKLTESNLAKIHPGMTMVQVEAILGPPRFLAGISNQVAYSGASSGPAWDAAVAASRLPAKVTSYYHGLNTDIKIEFLGDIVTAKEGKFE